MKSMIMGVAFGIALSSGTAEAGYICQSTETEVQLVIKEAKNSCFGDTKVYLKSDNGKEVFHGKIQTENSGFGTISLVQLYPFQGDVVKIVSQENCGRGGCDENSPLRISATVKIGAKETYFYKCNEINP